MTPAHHLYFTPYSSLAWATFYLLGLPDYYQSWPFIAKLILVILVNLAYFPATAYSLRRFFTHGDH
jgi:cytochrome c biogenesis protein ResB